MARIVIFQTNNDRPVAINADYVIEAVPSSAKPLEHTILKMSGKSEVVVTGVLTEVVNQLNHA